MIIYLKLIFNYNDFNIDVLVMIIEFIINRCDCYLLLFDIYVINGIKKTA